MVCSSGIGFDPVVDGRRLTFSFQGVYRGTAVLYDRETGSFWMHLTGECFFGPLAGRRLARLPSGRHTTFSDWRRGHPDTDVMLPDPRLTAPGANPHYLTGEETKSGRDDFPDPFPRTLGAVDPRLPRSALVYGVVVGGAARAYPFERLAKEPVVEELLGDEPVTVWFDAGSRSAAAWPRKLGDRLLSFEAAQDGLFREKSTGSDFDMGGRARSGPLVGTVLSPLFGLMAEWYGWSALHPETTVSGG